MAKPEHGQRASLRVRKETRTCLHCRYEYEAHLSHCSICGYPWPWLMGTKRKGRKQS